MLSRYLGFPPAPTVWTPALVQPPVCHLRRDGRQCKPLMRMVRLDQGERRVPTRTSLRPSWTVVGGKSTWRWPRGPGFPPAFWGVVARWRGFLYGESNDGGREEVVEFCVSRASRRSEEHTSELQSLRHLVCR